MAQNENDAQVHTVDELLTNIEQRGLSGQLFTQMASVADMALTNAHMAVTDSRITTRTPTGRCWLSSRSRPWPAHSSPPAQWS